MTERITSCVLVFLRGTGGSPVVLHADCRMPWASRPCHTGPRAFTLIEMMMALLIVGLLASAAVLSVAGPLRVVRSREAIDQLRNADDLARRAAIRLGRGATLRFNLSSGTIARFEGNHREEPSYQAALPQGFRIDEIRIGNQSIYADRADVTISSAGWSNSYALHLSGPKFQKWLVFAGLSGQTTQFDDPAVFGAMLAK